MEKIATEQLLNELISESTGVPAVTIRSTTTIEELGIDSLDFMELMVDVSTKFGVTIPRNRFLAIDTVGDILRELECR